MTTVRCRFYKSRGGFVRARGSLKTLRVGGFPPWNLMRLDCRGFSIMDLMRSKIKIRQLANHKILNQGGAQ